MKTKMLAKVPAATHPEIQPIHVPRFQIYRQSRIGHIMAELKTDSPTEALEMFAIISPAFDGGAIRVWDNREHRVCAAVEWRREATAFGFGVRHRHNVFHNPILTVLARQQAERETFREFILSGLLHSA